jgi:YggT family protein
VQEVVCLALDIYRLAVFAWIILSWVRISSTHPLARVVVFLDRIMYPVILPLRRIIPPVRLGGAMLDLSPVALLLGVSILRGLVCR